MIGKGIRLRVREEEGRCYLNNKCNILDALISVLSDGNLFAAWSQSGTANWMRALRASTQTGSTAVVTQDPAHPLNLGACWFLPPREHRISE